ncbi:MAG: ABC transporter substrate-binding protein [Rhodospirillales bacterium]|nr:ABC transporter substrate-binding protein [Rhodospirillales bacterium]
MMKIPTDQREAATARGQCPLRRPPSRLRRRFAAAAVLALFASGPVLADEAGNDPRVVVREFTDEAVAVIRDRDASPEQRRNHMRCLMDKAFDIDTIARLALGHHWNDATPAQRREYANLFGGMILESTILRLETVRERIAVHYGSSTDTIFDTLKVRITGFQQMDDRDSLVVTEIQILDLPPHQISYRVRTRSVDVKIVNVIDAGMNMVVTRRSEFAAYVRQHGLEGLLARMRGTYREPEQAQDRCRDQASGNKGCNPLSIARSAAAVGRPTPEADSR